MLKIKIFNDSLSYVEDYEGANPVVDGAVQHGPEDGAKIQIFGEPGEAYCLYSTI